MALFRVVSEIRGRCELLLSAAEAGITLVLRKGRSRGEISSLMHCEMCILLSLYTVFQKVAAMTSRKENAESMVLDNFVNRAIMCTTLGLCRI